MPGRESDRGSPCKLANWIVRSFSVGPNCIRAQQATGGGNFVFFRVVSGAGLFSCLRMVIRGNVIVLWMRTPRNCARPSINRVIIAESAVLLRSAPHRLNHPVNGRIRNPRHPRLPSRRRCKRTRQSSCSSRIAKSFVIRSNTLPAIDADDHSRWLD